jgi:hypothetical protein
VTSLYIYEISSSELVTRSFLAGDDYIIKTSPVFPIDKVDETSLFDSNTTETASSQIETETTEISMSTPSILELSINVTQEDKTAATTESVTTITMSTETEETMTPLDRFTTTSFGTVKPMETTLESESETDTNTQVFIFPVIHLLKLWKYF